MVVRIAGRNISTTKTLRYALTPIKGVGKNNVLGIIESIYTKTNKDKKITLKDFTNQKFADLTEEVTVAFRNLIETDYLVEADLRRKVLGDIKRLVDLKTWVGLRHKAGLPVHGQTTRTNSRTVRGNVRNTKGSGKIKSAAKT
jgi:small subunit ribosomal protein S13